MRGLPGLRLGEAWRGRGASRVSGEGSAGRDSARGRCGEWRGRGGRQGKGPEGGRGQRWHSVGGEVGSAERASFRRVGPEELAVVVFRRQGPPSTVLGRLCLEIEGGVEMRGLRGWRGRYPLRKGYLGWLAQRVFWW